MGLCIYSAQARLRCSTQQMLLAASRSTVSVEADRLRSSLLPTLGRMTALDTKLGTLKHAHCSVDLIVGDYPFHPNKQHCLFLLGPQFLHLYNGDHEMHSVWSEEVRFHPSLLGLSVPSIIPQQEHSCEQGSVSTSPSYPVPSQYHMALLWEEALKFSQRGCWSPVPLLLLPSLEFLSQPRFVWPQQLLWVWVMTYDDLWGPKGSG